MIPGIVAGVAVQSAPPVVQTVLSAVNIGANLSLVSTVLVEATGASAGMVLSDSGKTTGKFYAEVRCTQMNSSSQALSAGLRRGTASLNNYLGQSADGWGTWAEGVGGTTRSTYTNATQTNATTVGSNALNQRARIAVDVGAGQLWLSRFGNTAWIGGGDPAAGTSPTFTFTTGSDTYYLALNPRTGGTAPNRTRLELILPVNWATAAPAGFGVWT